MGDGRGFLVYPGLQVFTLKYLDHHGADDAVVHEVGGVPTVYLWVREGLGPFALVEISEAVGVAEVVPSVLESYHEGCGVSGGLVDLRDLAGSVAVKVVLSL